MSVSDSFVLHVQDYSQQDRNNAYKTLNLFRRISDTNQAELVSTIIYSYDELKKTKESVTENEVFQYIANWKKRYNTKDEEDRIRELSKRLTSMDLIQVDYTTGYKVNELF
ncbi:MAG: hypothetical protein J6E46_12390 [Faecalicoccus sp.]|nr:hypothetical protein [Faecalicoccus sp.]